MNSQVAKEWLAVYEKALRDRRAERDRLGLERETAHLSKELAKDWANRQVPEGAECLKARAKLTFRKEKVAPGEVIPAYDVDVAREIVKGLAVINRAFFGPAAQRSTPPAQLPVPVQAEAPAKPPAPAPGPREKYHRSTKLEIARRLEQYCDWADSNQMMPPDFLLAHFTDTHRHSWSDARAKAEERGYKFGDGNGKGYQVLARPIAAKAEPAPAPGEGWPPEFKAWMTGMEKALREMSEAINGKGKGHHA